METLDTEKQATRARFMPPLRGLDNRADDGSINMPLLTELLAPPCYSNENSDGPGYGRWNQC